VSKPIPPYLKLHPSDPAVSTQAAAPDDLPGLSELCLAFYEATGWPLRYASGTQPRQDFDLMWSAPVNPGVGVPPGHLRIDLGGPDLVEPGARCELETAERLAAALASLLSQLRRARATAGRDHATSPPAPPTPAPRDEPPGQLVKCLQVVLSAGAESLECDSVALYLLDDATTRLELQASWNLGQHQLPRLGTRPLADAIADLEALLGHAVVLENKTMMAAWNVPLACEAALCVPVASPTTPLGTLWFFCNRQRDFSPQQTHLAELIAGRAAAEWERARLLKGQFDSAGLSRQLEQLAEAQRHAYPAPLRLDQWELAGWTQQGAAVGGAFYDWLMLRDGRIALLLGDAGDGGLSAAMIAAALRAAARALVAGTQPLDQILVQLNDELWASGAGDRLGALFCGLLDPASGRLRYASAGRPSALWVSGAGHQWLAKPALPLGRGPELVCTEATRTLAPGEVLLLYNRGVAEAPNQRGNPLDEEALAQAVRRSLGHSATALIDVVLHAQQGHALRPQDHDRSVLVVRRLLRR
jgi:sigma-B regulation protein RsbU (phosphoserine phosphatase)